MHTDDAGPVSNPGRDPAGAPKPGDDGPARLQESIPWWLSEHRVTIPGRVIGYLGRSALNNRCMPTNRRITVLMAPGGFGKTVLMAECCRILAARGVPTAWLTLDAQDETSLLDTYLAFAFQRAGLDIVDPPPSAEARLPAHQRIEFLLRALEGRGEPCVLALDELERVTNAESVALINRLVRSGPRGLHLVVACRELPPGLDLSQPVFGGDAEILTVEDLRFSRQEISRFFGWKLSRRELQAVAAESAGWPIALRVDRNARARRGRAQAKVVRDVVDNWVASRLWNDLADEDRELLLDVGLLDWVDAELLDEVLSGTELMARLERMTHMQGLFEPVRGATTNVWRLHSLLREYCTERRRRETPRRYRSIHRRLAIALVRRGETVAALRHAAHTEDTGLVGRILSDQGGLRMLLREGPDRLVAADRFLTEATLARNPRLTLVRLVAYVMRGKLREARRMVAAGVRDRPPSDAGIDWDTDWCLARGLLAQNGCDPMGSELMRQVRSEMEHLSESSKVEPGVRVAFEYGLCEMHEMKGEFDRALERDARARQGLGPESAYVRMALDFTVGQVAMAQGRVQEALAWYGRGQDAARRSYLNDPRLAVFGEVLTLELNLERNGIHADGKAARIPREFWQRGAQFSSYAAASAMAAEMALMRQGVDAALSLVDEMVEFAHRATLTALVRYLGGLRVALLAGAGRVAKAEESWRISALPSSSDGCLDLTGQGWREMEMLSCARLRLLFARGDVDAGRRLAGELARTASDRGLRRTEMRARALCMALQESAGQRTAALGNLSAFLGLYSATDYAGAVVREGDTAVAVLEAMIDSGPDSAQRASAEALLSTTKPAGAVSPPALGSRTIEVLRRLETQTDNEIARALGMTRDGVRYHVRALFAKLDARDRREAVQRARSLGLLSSDR